MIRLILSLRLFSLTERYRGHAVSKPICKFCCSFNKLNGDVFVNFGSFLDGIEFYFLFLRSRKLIKPAVKSCCFSYRLFIAADKS